MGHLETMSDGPPSGRSDTRVKITYYTGLVHLVWKVRMMGLRTRAKVIWQKATSLGA